MDKVQLRYLGSSDFLEDPATGLCWEAHGDAHAVSVEDAERLMATSRFDQWERVSDEEFDAERKSAEDRAEAERKHAERVARAEAKRLKAEAEEAAAAERAEA